MMEKTVGHFLCSLVALSVMLTLASASTSWWSLGVEDISKVSQNSQLLSSINCDTLNRSLASAREKEYCEKNQTLVQLIAIGSRRGIVQCQERFAERRWNCTTFLGDDLFGKFINDGTRETGLVNAMLAAGAGLEIAAACRNEDLTYCTCQVSGINRFDNGNYKTYACDYDPTVAKELLNDFFNDNEQLDEQASAQRRAEIHNHNVGLEQLAPLTETCRCIGLSGACTVQTCYFKSPDIEDIGKSLQQKYDAAVEVSLGNNNMDLVPNNQQIIDGSIIHVKQSPSFCLSDVSKGIIGTEDRECSDQDHCSSLCCDRGHYAMSTTTTIEKCEFVWCCRLECEDEEKLETNYFCNAGS